MTQRVQVTCDFPGCREAVGVALNPVVRDQELARLGWGSVAVTQAATKRFDLCPAHAVTADRLMNMLAQFYQLRDLPRGFNTPAEAAAPLDEEERHL